jgi:hypothetical protein
MFNDVPHLVMASSAVRYPGYVSSSPGYAGLFPGLSGSSTTFFPENTSLYSATVSVLLLPPDVELECVTMRSVVGGE